jgi:hypothetical protein
VLGAKQKAFLLKECPWKSKNIAIFFFLLFVNSNTTFLQNYISGIINVWFLRNSLFKSFPYKLVLKFPTTTPSGFNIGITWKLKFLRKLRIYFYVLFTSSYKKPFKTWLPLDSPGCCLPIKKIFFFLTF